MKDGAGKCAGVVEQKYEELMRLEYCGRTTAQPPILDNHKLLTGDTRAEIGKESSPVAGLAACLVACLLLLRSGLLSSLA